MIIESSEDVGHRVRYGYDKMEEEELPWCNSQFFLKSLSLTVAFLHVGFENYTTKLTVTSGMITPLQPERIVGLVGA